MTDQAKFVEIRHGVVVFFDDEFGQVDVAQIAGFHGQQRLLTARVGGFQAVQVADRVGLIGGIQEKQAFDELKSLREALIGSRPPREIMSRAKRCAERIPR